MLFIVHYTVLFDSKDQFVSLFFPSESRHYYYAYVFHCCISRGESEKGLSAFLLIYTETLFCSHPLIFLGELLAYCHTNIYFVGEFVNKHY